MRRALGITVLAAACADATPPARPEPYGYTISLEEGFQIVFRWPQASLPVRIWVPPEAGLLRQHAADAIRLWEGVALYGEFRGVTVRDSSRADVFILSGPAQPFNGGPGERLDCGGVTTIGVELDTTITLPFRITLTPRSGAGPDDIDRCFRIVTAHELGHALGLFLHSDDPADLMFARPTSGEATLRDRATFDILYHSPATVRVPPDR